MSAEISSTFYITVDETIAAGVTKTIANPGRAFRVVSVLVTGADTATCDVYKNPATGPDVLIAQAVLDVAVMPGLTDIPAQLQGGIADQKFTSTDAVNVAAGVANITRVVLVCTGNPSQALTVS